MTPENLLIIARIQAGMDVCDSEHEKIGRAVKVYRGADYGTPPPSAMPKIIEPYLEVDHGGTHLFMPTSYVSDVTDDCVVLNIVGEKVDDMGWEHRPDFLRDAPNS